MIIDSHVHVWAADTPLWPERSYTPDHPTPMDTMLSVMDAHGVDGAVLVQPSFLGTDNGYLLEALAKHPDRFRGVAVVDTETTSGALEDLRAAGVTGLRLNIIHGVVPDVSTDSWRGLFARAVVAGLHIQLHLDASMAPKVLPPIVAAGAVVVVDHFGRPDPHLGAEDPEWRSILDLGRDDRHRVKLSAPYRLGGVAPEALMPGLLEAFGPAGLLWGSDYPWTRHEAGRSYQACLDSVTTWVAAADARTRVLSHTAAELYDFRSVHQA
ncbi:MAG: amidohydrolase family protein [Alphaproteobacteria bacterium]|nr:amidohydrolase family protein [Alphaproteobacteria bacterium]